ncbi:DNA polymerase-3 subunit epsilon [Idiomarina loihiensis]|uniref:3'-5' exonuclease n=1 Tax=Idiomarina TaxID=135575 RepID=UPI000D71D98D|nr:MULTISPECIES: 3'-5' exonuclease [Idiomarina]PWW33411.1 DNA polymerase-3 subunit epsilon [Idiomarina loihiensis]TDP43720.1 DNA polymerase-3 subunit epsilon [Idiomarina loihiensis]TDS18470.1 DNA polymerase-3 subunit epsilon [Idiomarina sp. H2]
MAQWLQKLAHWYDRRQKLKQPWQSLRYVALDIESTGLNPKKHQILSIAWMTIHPPVMHYGNAQYHVFSHGQELKLGQSPTIHGLTRQDFLHSSEPKQTFAMLSRVLNDAVLVCHHKGMDWRFLKHIEAQYNIPFRPLAIFDTLAYEKNKLERSSQQPLKAGELTLSACRKRYNLPDYHAHHALTDTVACAELFLAQCYAFESLNEPLRSFLKNTH